MTSRLFKFGQSKLVAMGMKVFSYFNHFLSSQLNCIPFVCVTHQVQECLKFEKIVHAVEKLPSFAKLVSSFRKPITSTSVEVCCFFDLTCSWRVSLLHG